MTKTRQQHYLTAAEYFRALASGKQKPKDRFQLINGELIQFLGMSGVVTRVLDLLAEYGNGSRTMYLDNIPLEDYYQGRINVFGGKYKQQHDKIFKQIAAQLTKESSQ